MLGRQIAGRKKEERLGSLVYGEKAAVVISEPSLEGSRVTELTLAG
jgi:hypothetical protein